MKKQAEEISNFVLMCLAFAFRIFILQCMWNWFISPITSLNGISFSEAFGLVLIIAFLKRRAKKTKSPTTDDILKTMLSDGLTWAVAYGLYNYLT